MPVNPGNRFAGLSTRERAVAAGSRALERYEQVLLVVLGILIGAFLR